MNKYFLKCDISGIQSFIFNVPGDGAAKQLKNRSVHIQRLSDECLNLFKEHFMNDSIKELYNGGGNFYLKIETGESEKEISGFITAINEKYREKDIFPYFAFIVINNETKDISKLLEAVNKKMQKVKLQRPVSFDLLDKKQEKAHDIDIKDLKGINGQVPRDKNGNVLDFDEIADLSVGDKKLAALKLDVDNLGKLFRDRTEKDYKELSNALQDFFDAKFFQLIKKLGMQQYIYVVFSGGDDCFLIGTWEKIFELAIVLRQEFEKFQNGLKNKVNSLPQKEVTFSAGIVVIPPKYPMMRLAEGAEEALMASKRVEKKNSVTVFGKTLSWQEFEQSQKISTQLFDLIDKKEESKSLIERIKLSDIGFDKLQKNALKGKINLPKVWRLKYYLRNVKKQNEEEVKKIFEEYTKAILDAFMRRKATSPDTYPVAARWAELLLKE